MVKDNLYTIPAEYVDGDVMVTPEYVTDDAGSKGDYALNFPKDLKITRTDRALNSLSFNTTTQSTAQKLTPTDKLVYQDFSNRSVYVKDGDVITTNVNYTPNKMPICMSTCTWTWTTMAHSAQLSMPMAHLLGTAKCSRTCTTTTRTAVARTQTTMQGMVCLKQPTLSRNSRYHKVCPKASIVPA